jgi:hypothetical protein
MHLATTQISFCLASGTPTLPSRFASLHFPAAESATSSAGSSTALPDRDGAGVRRKGGCSSFVVLGEGPSEDAKLGLRERVLQPRLLSGRSVV